MCDGQGCTLKAYFQKHFVNLRADIIPHVTELERISSVREPGGCSGKPEKWKWTKSRIWKSLNKCECGRSSLALRLFKLVKNLSNRSDQ